jgi:C4-dicarboxylate transporter DctM subunit
LLLMGCSSSFDDARPLLAGLSAEPAGELGRARRATLRALPACCWRAGHRGIYTGAATPTEAAAIGFAAALVITAVVLGTLTWKGFKEAVLTA